MKLFQTLKETQCVQRAHFLSWGCLFHFVTLQHIYIPSGTAQLTKKTALNLMETIPLMLFQLLLTWLHLQKDGSSLIQC